MNILALDDEKGALRILMRAIEKAAPTAKLIGFTTSDEALEFSSGNPVDVAFVDIQLNGVNGLDVAKRLRVQHPEINIIFTTSYSDFAIEAFRMRSSGYLLKPITKDAVAAELVNLRKPVTATEGVFVRCFGNFDLIINGVTVEFRRKLAKELLAYLVDCEGVEVSRKEVASVLFEDKPYNRTMQSYLTQIVASLKGNLIDVGADSMLTIGRNYYKVNREAFACDAYRYLEGDPLYVDSWNNAYMEQYSWAEDSKYKFGE